MADATSIFANVMAVILVVLVLYGALYLVGRIPGIYG